MCVECVSTTSGRRANSLRDEYTSMCATRLSAGSSSVVVCLRCSRFRNDGSDHVQMRPTSRSVYGCHRSVRVCFSSLDFCRVVLVSHASSRQCAMGHLAIALMRSRRSLALTVILVSHFAPKISRRLFPWGLSCVGTSFRLVGLQVTHRWFSSGAVHGRVSDTFCHVSMAKEIFSANWHLPLMFQVGFLATASA